MTKIAAAMDILARLAEDAGRARRRADDYEQIILNGSQQNALATSYMRTMLHSAEERLFYGALIEGAFQHGYGAAL